jgi:RNA polymerase sigma-70 factor (ECF subfamily)
MSPVFWIAAAAFALRIVREDELVARIRSGDHDAVRDLVTRHHAALIGLARTIVKSRETAEDVAQETWIAVMTGIDRFDGRSSLATWIIAILLNKARTAARRAHRYVPLAAETGDDLGEPAVDPARFSAGGHWVEPPMSFAGADPERVVAGRQMWKHVAAAMETLPPAQRAVLILRDVEGRDAAEACALLEISPENQRILLHRARAKVRATVEAILRAGDREGIAKA